LYASPNIIIRVIESRRMRWTGHVARMGEMKNPYTIFVGKREGKRLYTADQDIDGKILELILGK